MEKYSGYIFGIIFLVSYFFFFQKAFATVPCGGWNNNIGAYNGICMYSNAHPPPNWTTNPSQACTNPFGLFCSSPYSCSDLGAGWSDYGDPAVAADCGSVNGGADTASPLCCTYNAPPTTPTPAPCTSVSGAYCTPNSCGSNTPLPSYYCPYIGVTQQCCLTRGNPTPTPGSGFGGSCYPNCGTYPNCFACAPPPPTPTPCPNAQIGGVRVSPSKGLPGQTATATVFASNAQRVDVEVKVTDNKDSNSYVFGKNGGLCGGTTCRYSFPMNVPSGFPTPQGGEIYTYRVQFDAWNVCAGQVRNNYSTGIATMQYYSTITGSIYLDNNNDGAWDNGEPGANNVPGYSGITEQLTWNGGQRNPNPIGNNNLYTEANLQPNNYTMKFANFPAGFGTHNNVTQLTVGVPPNQTVNFGIVPLFSISGSVYVDTSDDGYYQTGSESVFNAQPSTVKILNKSNQVVQTITTSSGNYTTGNTLPASGSPYTVQYTSLPQTMQMTYPLNGPPPSFQVTVGTGANGSPNCSVGSAQIRSGGGCSNGNITGLDFGIIPYAPWTQVTCTDLRSDNGITDEAPATGTCGSTTNSYVSITDGGNVCTIPGIVYTGDGTGDFAPGQASSSNQVVGGASYSENFAPVNPGIIRTSYNYLLTTATENGITPISLDSVCPILSDCTLPADLADGVYIASGDATLNAYTFSAGKNYVILVNGNLTIDGNILVPTGSSVLFSSSDNIIVDASVGETDVTSQDANIEGLYSADNSFVINSNGTTNNTCNADGSSLDKRLNIVGSVIANARATGGTLINHRDLCNSDYLCPALSISLGNGNVSGNRPNAGIGLTYLINAPAFIKHPNTVWQEVAP